MISLFVIVPLVLFFLAVRFLSRLLGFGRFRRRGPFGGYGSFGGYNRFGNYGGGWGRRRRGFGGSGLLTVLGLLALESFFHNRRP